MWASVIWLILNLVVSVPLLHTVFSHLKEKNPVLVSLIDLVYRDLLVYLYSLCFFLTVSIIHCLFQLQTGQALGYWTSEVYTIIQEILGTSLFSSLIISGVLRFLTLWSRSEETELQLLGPENVAIVKLRFMSAFLSITFEAVMVGYFKVHTGIFVLLHSLVPISITSDINNTRSKIIFALLPVASLVVNLGVKIYSMFLKRKLDAAIRDIDDRVASIHSFCLPMDAILIVASTLTYSVLTSFADRTSRLLFYFPLHFTIILIGVPALAIAKNNKMKSHLAENYVKPIMDPIYRCISRLLFLTQSNAVIPISD